MDELQGITKNREPRMVKRLMALSLCKSQLIVNVFVGKVNGSALLGR